MKQRLDFLVQIIREWRAKRISQRSASLAYFSLLSIAPLTLLALLLLPFILGEGVLEYEVLTFLSHVFGEYSIPFFERVLMNISAVKGEAVYAAVAAFLLFYGTGKLFLNLKRDIQEVLDQDIVQAEGKVIERVVRERGHGLAFLGVLFVLGFVFISVNVFLSTLTSNIAFLVSLSPLIVHVLNTLVTLLVVSALYACVYRVGSSGEMGWRCAFVGGAVASLLFVILNGVFALYLSSSVFLSLFGGATFILALLLWMYYGAHILFIGALVAKVYNQGI